MGKGGEYEMKLAVVGIFFDGYYDLWEDFLELFSLHWPDCPYELYIVNNEKELDYDNKYKVKVLHAGKDAEYSRKVQIALREIDADYYLLLLEDFWLQVDILNDPIEHVLHLMRDNNICYYRMQLPEFSKKDAPMDGPTLIDSAAEYTVSCQPSIWEKEFLKKCIGSRNYNAWIFEGIYSYSQKAHTEEFLKKCRVDYSNPLGLRHLAVQGKLLPNVYNDFVKTGYRFRTKREVLDEKAYNKHLRKQWLKRNIPIRIQKILKKIIKTNSVVERYKSEIVDEMKFLGID